MRGAALPLLLLIPLLFGSGCISIHFFDGGAAAPLQETTVWGEEGPKVLLVEIDGVIDGSNWVDPLLGEETPSMVARVREVLDRAREDDEVRAVLLRIDSPGGSATASEQVYTEIVRFKQERDVPVTAQLLSTAASGGYYIAMSADDVQAHPTTVTGSIGVIYTSLNFAGLMDKLGVEDQTITGGRYKDVGSPFRPLTAEERAQLQSIVDDLHERFREIVARGRPDLTPEEIDELANGSVYSARQAVENGLVDRIGTVQEAAESLGRRIGVPEVRVVAYHRPREVRRNLYSQAALPAMGRKELALGDWAGATPLGGLQRLLARPGFHYLWWPGIGAD
ncbi:MAG: signal peptide peptidase SppA [Deltaproteobacteria bacterium]|jgi:protease-4|nr:signal peptide peptidase SppA [Deltaproteobacteria bacterium]